MDLSAILATTVAAGKVRIIQTWVIVLVESAHVLVFGILAFLGMLIVSFDEPHI